ncbi:DUF2243 domain-containing protein [Streptomyces zhihengii]|uniref:DUF2243 domain-containing protein n=1 Tax=Streptomyces zhihengii TaxID=1818004 RepID=UPI003641D797
MDHKLLRLHQIRFGVHIISYDLAWNAAAVVLLAAGALLALRAARGGRGPSPRGRWSGRSGHRRDRSAGDRRSAAQTQGHLAAVA